MFRRFLGVFATPEHSLALFLDDLEWLDAATLDLLEHLGTHPDVRHLLLVGAYRDNEVSPSHPLLRTLQTIRNVGAWVEEIALSPLKLKDIGQHRPRCAALRTWACAAPGATDAREDRRKSILRDSILHSTD